MAAEAKVYAFKMTIICPNPKCGEAIKADDSGITWTTIPPSVQCQACGKVSRVAKTIRPEN